jgi:hypothetical protein
VLVAGKVKSVIKRVQNEKSGDVGKSTVIIDSG